MIYSMYILYIQRYESDKCRDDCSLIMTATYMDMFRKSKEQDGIGTGVYFLVLIKTPSRSDPFRLVVETFVDQGAQGTTPGTKHIKED